MELLPHPSQKGMSGLPNTTFSTPLSLSLCNRINKGSLQSLHYLPLPYPHIPTTALQCIEQLLCGWCRVFQLSHACIFQWHHQCSCKYHILHATVLNPRKDSRLDSIGAHIPIRIAMACYDRASILV